MRFCKTFIIKRLDLRLEHSVPENVVFYLGRFALMQASHSFLLWHQPKYVKRDLTVDPFSGAVMNKNTPIPQLTHTHILVSEKKFVLQNSHT